MGTGIDVGARRVSALGKEVIRFALSGTSPSKVYVEIGPGKGRLATIMALFGFICHLYDPDPSLPGHYARLNTCFGVEGRLNLRTLDVREVRYGDIPEGIGVLVAERVLHHLPFKEAVDVLKRFGNRMLPGGRLFVSLSGLNSPIGEGYPHRNVPVERRYAPLREDVADKFKIFGKVCLYTIDDARKLMEKVGKFEEILVKETAFGNVMAIYRRTVDRNT